MRKKLIKLLSNVSCNGNGESLGSCPDRKYGLCGEVAELSYCAIQNIANHLVANGVTIQRWIPVSEGLPDLHTDEYEELDGSRMQFEVSDPVWVMTESGCQTKAQYEYGPVFQGWVGEFGETVRATNWMPLPPAPEGN